MFKQLFASMNDALDEIITQIDTASGAKREELEERLAVLKAMSDTCIEEWLLFEEKLGKLSPAIPSAGLPAAVELLEQLEAEEAKVETATAPKVQPKPKVHPPAAVVAQSEPVALKASEEVGSFSKGQGFYKLAMFEDAVSEFEYVVQTQPDFLLARIYLAMSYLRCGEYTDAYRHFQFLLPLTDDDKMKAISYNAMGCIQVEKDNLDKAIEYFQLAHSADPSSVEPVINLKAWDKRG